MGIVRWVASGAAGLGLVGAGYTGLAGQDETVRDQAGQVVEGGELGALRVRVGDCIDAGVANEVESVDGVPCAQPHEYEVYSAFNLDGSTYPGDEAVSHEAEQGCFARFEPFVGMSYAESVYDFSALMPTQGTWDELDDREVLCLIGNLDGTPKTGSAAGTAR